MTKAASGLIPSDSWPTDDMREDHSDDECTEQRVEQAERVPLSAQQEVDHEAERCATECAVQEPWTPIPWPSISRCIDDLLALSASIFRTAVCMFAAKTDLDLDKLHPRAISGVQMLQLLCWRASSSLRRQLVAGSRVLESP